MRVFVFLHVATMFGAVSMGYGSILLMRTAAESEDPGTLRGVTRAVKMLNRFIGPAFMVGILLGIVAVFTNGFNPLAPWLLIAYVLAIAATVSAFVILDPFVTRVSTAVERSDEAVAEARADIRSPRTVTLLTLDSLIIVALIADMILKPFS